MFGTCPHSAVFSILYMTGCNPIRCFHAYPKLTNSLYFFKTIFLSRFSPSSSFRTCANLASHLLSVRRASSSSDCSLTASASADAHCPRTHSICFMNARKPARQLNDHFDLFKNMCIYYVPQTKPKTLWTRKIKNHVGTPSITLLESYRIAWSF